MDQDNTDAALPQNPPPEPAAGEPEASHLRPGRPFRESDTPFSLWLEDSGKTAQEIATATGLSISSIYGIRKGTQKVSLETAAKLIKISDGALTIDSFLIPKQPRS